MSSPTNSSGSGQPPSAAPPAPLPPITGRAVVSLSVDRAFAMFTASIGAWWPHEYHIGAADVADVVLEPRVGGRWFERGVDGSECDWGRVLAWEPPHRVLFTWQINGMWQFDPDPGHASEIEVLFRADDTADAAGAEQTLVEVEHRHFERLVAGEAARAAITGGGGWEHLLAGYAKLAADTEASS